jgi:hypothetical protein
MQPIKTKELYEARAIADKAKALAQCARDANTESGASLPGNGSAAD